MNNFNDRWNKLTLGQQEEIKKRTQEKINSGYDPNKIKNHIENNLGNTTSTPNILPVVKIDNVNNIAQTPTVKPKPITDVNNTNEINNEPVIKNINKAETESKRNNWSEVDELKLKNILSYGQNGKSLEKQKEITKQRALREQRIQEIEKGKKEMIKNEIKSIPNVVTNARIATTNNNNIGGKKYTEEEWNKRLGNLEKKEEIIEKVKKEREEKSGNNILDGYNYWNNEKEGQESKSDEQKEKVYKKAENFYEHGLSRNSENVSSEVRKEFDEFINNKSNYIWATTLLHTAGFGGTGINNISDLGKKLGSITDYFGTDDLEGKIGKNDTKTATKFLAKFMYGDGSPEYFGNNHWISEKIRDTSSYKYTKNDIIQEVKDNMNKYKNGEKFEIKDPFNGYNETFDLGSSIGGATYKAEAYINNKGNLVIDYKVYDSYNFHYANENGEVETNPWNKAGVYYQMNGYGKPFDFTIHLSEEIPLN